MVFRLSELELANLLKNSHAKIANNIQPSPPNLERPIRHVAKKPYADKAFDKRVVITVHSFRYREADPDGLCAKYHIDSIVDSGLLFNDTPEEIEEVRFRQTKIKKPEEEKTVITIKEINERQTASNVKNKGQRERSASK